MTHLVPTLDHAVINVRDRVDAAAEAFQGLGFTLTPRGYHTLGSMNHLAMFGTDYLELIAAKPGDTSRPEIMGAPEGLDGLVFGTEDAVETFAAMERAEVPVFPYGEFSRPVELPGGPRDAIFRTVRLKPDPLLPGRLYFCQHLTRNLVWRDEWRHHPNGVTGIARAVIVGGAPLAELFARMFGEDAVRAIEGGHSLTVGLSRFDILTPAAVWTEFGDAAPEARGRRTYMAALEFRTRSLEAAAAATGGWLEGSRVVVPASAAFGATLAFSL